MNKEMKKDNCDSEFLDSEEIAYSITNLNDSVNAIADLSKKVDGELQALKKYIFSEYRLNDEQEIYATDIRKEMWLLAGRSSAKYAIEHMNSAKMYENADELRGGVLKDTFDGLYLEFGVYSGYTINQIASLKHNNTIYGFDSFEGLPETWRDGYEVGAFRTDSLPKVRENVILIKGWFNETLPKFLGEHTEKVAFVHIDCDLYSSTHTVFNNIRSRLQSGTIIVFDEFFNYPGWEQNECKAFEELIEETGLQYEFVGFVPSHQQAAVKIL